MAFRGREPRTISCPANVAVPGHWPKIGGMNPSSGPPSKPDFYLWQRLSYRGSSTWQITARDSEGYVHLRCVCPARDEKHGDVQLVRPVVLLGDQWTALPDDGPLTAYVDVGHG